jgi:O-antigen/teichoic acid export membrane protein
MSAGSDSDGLYSSLRSVTRGASVFVAGRGLSNVAGFFFNLLMARGLGAGLYGIYTYGYTLVLILANFALIGTDKALLRFLSEYNEERSEQNRILGLASVTSVVGSVVAASLLYILAPLISSFTLETPLLTSVLQVLAIFIPIRALTKTVSSVFRSLELPEYQILTLNVVPPFARLAAAGIALAAGATLIGVTAAIVASGVIAFGVALVLFLSRLSLWPSRGNSREELVDFYNYSIPLTFQHFGQMLYREIDLLMVGVLLSGSAAVGIYKIAIVIAGFLQLPLSGFNQLFPSVASRLYTRGQFNELEAVYSRVTRWTFTVSLLPAIGVIVYAEEVLSLFGSAFTAGEPVLLLVVFAQLANTAVGPTKYLLMMTDHQYLSLANEWILGGLNIILNVVLIDRFGIVGAALATVIVFVGVNAFRVVEIWYTEQLFPYSLKFLKPLFAGIVAGSVMAILGTVFSGFILLMVGGSAGAITFVLSLLLLGVEQEDREFFIESIPNIGE